MGKICTTVLGLGVAGTIIGMELYRCMDNKDRRELKKDVKCAVEDLKTATGKIMEMH